MSTTALFFIFFFFSGLLMAFVKHPIYGVYSYMLVLYMGPGEAWWSENLPNLRWSLLAASLTAIAAFTYRTPASRPPWFSYAPIRWLIFFSLWVWIQTPWALNLHYHLFLASLFTKYVLLYIILYLSFTDEKKVQSFFFAHIIGCLYWGFLAYQNPGTGRLEKIGFGDLAGSAFASMQISTSLAFAGFAFLFVSGVRKWIALCSIPFLLNAIILMATRGAFVGLLVGAFAALFFSPKSKRIMIIFCLVVAGFLLTYLANDLFWERMITILPDESTGALEASAASRIDIVIANLKMFQDHPFGVGHRGNDLLSPLYLSVELLTPKDGENIRSSHNTVMALLVDHSVIGLILIMFFHLSIIRLLLNLKNFKSAVLIGNKDLYVGAFCTSLFIYWVNAQFANFIKAEVIVWIAAMISSLEWIGKTSLQTFPPLLHPLENQVATLKQQKN